MHLLNSRTYFNFPLMDISVRIFFKVCPILHYFVCLRGSKQPVVAVVTWRRPVVFPPAGTNDDTQDYFQNARNFST